MALISLDAHTTQAYCEDIVAQTRRQLGEQPARAADYIRENEALLLLADELAQRPSSVLQTLSDLVLDVCRAGSAGVSLLQSDNEDADFHWPAVAGAWAPVVGCSIPRHDSPCGVVLECDAVVVYRNVAETFPSMALRSPPIHEIILAPFHQDGKPIGTVWAMAHATSRKFDREDERLLVSLARFAAAAYQTVRSRDAARNTQKQLELLNQELGHRLKNTLTMITAIAGQTLKRVTERDLVDTFQHRVRALGAGHDVLLKQAWTSAPIDLVAKGVLAETGQQGRIDLSGPPLTLGPRAALSLSLILHELVTNAIKHGSLSVEGGRVALNWATNGTAEDARFTITWQESGGPAVKQVRASGFGSKLIKRGLLGLGGTRIHFAAEGLRAELEAPLRSVQKD